MAAITNAADALELMDRIYWRLRTRRPEIEMFEAYHSGDQKLTFATDEWLKANGARYANFSDNWCASVVNAPSERTRLIGLNLRDEDPMGRDAATAKRASALWDQWLINEMDAQSSAGFLTAYMAKRSYVLVWGDGEDAQITFEHPANVEIEYDWMNSRRRKAALKTWVDEDWEYGTLYTPEFLWKFQRPRVMTMLQYLPQSVQMEERGFGASSLWVARDVKDTGDDVWPLPNPMGVVPIVEVKNRPMLRGEPVSEIAGVIPMQDAINLLWAYLFFAADYASMPARVLLGAKPPMRQILDAAGIKVGEEPLTMAALNESRFAVFSGETAKIDQWDAANLAVFTDVIEIAVGHIAAQTRTPPTYLAARGGITNVSADGLRASESPLIEKVREFQTGVESSMREVFRMVALAQDDQALAKEVRLASIEWENPAIRSEAQMADALLKDIQIGYPFGWVMEKDGVDPYDRARIMDMKQDESDALTSFAVHGALNEQMNNDPNVAPTDVAAE